MKNTNIALLKKVTVLYAEDEQSLRDVTAGILKGFTKKQFIAEDGAIGLELFKNNQDEIDLVITDINMPNMNGLEMTYAIKKINPNIPIIVATAFSNTEYLLEAINMGVDKYVLKPVDIKKLLQVMSQSLLYHELKTLYLDKLTKLANRNKLKKDLNATKYDLMALINIDKFSTLNDLYGEDNGDKILIEFSNRLISVFKSDEYICYRVEADKFAVRVIDVEKDIEEFKAVCENLLDSLDNNQIMIEDNDIDINITVGIAKGEDTNAYKYTQRVITYARKKLKTIMVYDDSFNIKESFEENIMWVKNLKVGLTSGKFRAFYQPIVDVQTREIYKYESLIRYIEEDGTVISPFKFLDIAKKARLFPKVIGVMIKDVLNTVKEKRVKVAVNISFEDIASQDTCDLIEGLLKDNIEYTKYIDFELLESEEITDFSIVQEFIKMVKDLGCNVGVDDFGAGYSNFNMLVSLDIDFVKIDGSLINGIDKSENLQIIVKTIINFSKQFGFKTVAEYVCNEAIFDKVKEIGIDYVQGYYLSKPISYDELP